MTHAQDLTNLQVQFLVEAAVSTGLTVKGTMNKHKAAFLISYNDQLKRGNYLVYDLGQDVLEVSWIQAYNDRQEVFITKVFDKLGS